MNNKIQSIIISIILLTALFSSRACFQQKQTAHFKAVQVAQEQKELFAMQEKLSAAYDNIIQLQNTIDSLASIGTPVDWFVSRYQFKAINNMHKYGIPASITLGQGIMESKAGLSKLAKKCNNLHGLKCFSIKCSPGHCQNFKDEHRKCWFKSFNTPEESFDAHAKLLQKKRYTRQTKNLSKRDYEQWAIALQMAGYATDPNYANKLISVIKRYKLYQFDG